MIEHLASEVEDYVRTRLNRPGNSDRFGDMPICATDRDVNIVLARRGLIFCGYTNGQVETYPLC